MGSIIGRGGANIKELQLRTRVHIKLPQPTDPGGEAPPGMRVVRFEGTPADVAYAPQAAAGAAPDAAAAEAWAAFYQQSQQQAMQGGQPAQPQQGWQGR